MGGVGGVEGVHQRSPQANVRRELGGGLGGTTPAELSCANAIREMECVRGWRRRKGRDVRERERERRGEAVIHGS